MLVLSSTAVVTLCTATLALVAPLLTAGGFSNMIGLGVTGEVNSIHPPPAAV
jgi:hypothetical protein